MTFINFGRAQKKYLLNLLAYTSLFLISYYFLTKFEVYFSYDNNKTPLFSISAALGLAGCLYFGKISFPLVFIASCLTLLNRDLSHLLIIALASSNTIEAIVGSYILENRNKILLNLPPDYKKILSYFIVLIFAVSLNAYVYCFSLGAHENIFSGSFAIIFTQTWLSRCLGILLFYPLFTSGKNWMDNINKRKSFQTLALLILGIFISKFISHNPEHQLSLIFLILPVILISTQISALSSKLLLLTFSLSLFYFMPPMLSHKETVGRFSIIDFQIILISIAFIRILYSKLNNLRIIKTTFSFILATWVISGFSIFIIENFERNEFNNYLNTQILDASEKIKVRMSKYESALRGGAGLFLASKSVEREEWKSYIESLNIKENFPGIMGIGFIKYLPKNETDSFIRNFKKESKNDFKIYNLENNPFNKDETSYPIIYIEPLKGNEKAVGLNIASEINRREAANRAAKSRQPTLTKTITLVQDSKKRPGYLLLYPVYKENLLLGWIYSPLVIDELLGGIFSNATNQIGFRVYDKLNHSKENPLYLSEPTHKNAYFKLTEHDFWSQSFNFEWFTKMNFSKEPNIKSLITFIVLNLIFYLLIIMISNINLQGIRTQSIVEDKTLELQNKEKLWRTLTESSPLGILQTDIFGSCQYANSKFTQLFQTTINEIEGTLWTNICHSNDLESINIEWKKYHDTNNLNVDFRAKSTGHNNSEIWISVMGSPVINEEGITYSHILSFQDITKAKSQLLTLAQSSKMASLGEMASGIAHEINNPLSIINGYAQKLLRNEEKGSNTKETIKDNLEKILKTTNRITQIIKGLKNFSRSGDGDSHIESSIKHLVEDVYSFCSERFRNHSIQFTMEIPEDVKFESQTTQISQTILNLMNNSHDAIIDLPEKWIKIDYQSLNENRFALRFSDSGPGIAPEIVDKLMQPFFTTKGPGKGTGLGLSISKGIIESHNGKFYVDQNSPNTCFVIELPYKQNHKLKFAA